MPLNDHPCQQCKNYDAIRQGTSNIANRGWCTIRSVYPAVEGPGQCFPEGVKRARPGELAQPHIVVGTGVKSGCADFTQK